MCHVAFPKLNDFGQRFRDNGYQFLQGKDDPVTFTPGYVPIALRTTPAYEYTRTTNSPDFPRPMTVQHGGVPVPPGVDILAGSPEELTKLMPLEIAKWAAAVKASGAKPE